ncbi:MAG: hypothetical protein R3B91_14460 [Planctomycetaceae bacterium]
MPPEFRFLDNALSRDPHVEVEAVVFQQPYLGDLAGDVLLDAGATGTDRRCPQSPFDYDAVIVGDIALTDLSEQARTLLDRFVRDEEGTPVLTAGRHGFPQLHQSRY